MSSHPDSNLSNMLNSVLSALRDCTERHGDSCDRSRYQLLHSQDPSPWPLESKTELVVLNVNTFNLETISMNDDFVALSYVWGQKTGATFWMSADGGNLKRFDATKLPRTLLDAIMICRMLGYQYIWIDQLCIDQRDSTALGSLINQMHRIYASATATVVVACNTCADEDIRCQIQRGQVTPLEHWTEELRTSVWAQRAWTYQEMQLSRRLVIITRSGIWFHCIKVNNKIPAWSLPSIDHISCWSAYNTIITEYTGRKLSYKTDNLNAIAGIARSLARFADDSFLAGIPSKQIWWAILWQPTGPSIRLSQFPSWSWAGWTGYGQSMCTVFHPSYHLVQGNHNRDRNRDPRLFSALENLTFRVSDSDVPIKLTNQTSFKLPDRNLEYCESTCHHPCPNLAHLMPDKPFYEKGKLSFVAEIIELDIVPTQQCSPRFPLLHQCRLLHGGVWIGSMFVAEDVLPGADTTSGEFIVLTRFKAYVHEYKRTVFGDMLGPETNINAFDDEFLEFAEKETEWQWQEWMGGGWHSKFGRTKHDLRGRAPEYDDHYGMPFPSEISMHHVLWIERDENQDQLVNRKGLGIIMQSICTSRPVEVLHLA